MLSLKILKTLIFFCTLMTSSLYASKTTLLLIRHGETHWNVIGKIQGQLDVPLNETGTMQAQKAAILLAKKHPDISHIYSSDLSRSATTAKILSQAFNLSVSTHPMLREVHRGKSEGLYYEEADKLYGKWKEAIIPEAETRLEATSRIKSFLIDCANTHAEKKIAVVTHGMLLEFLLIDLLGPRQAHHLSNCSTIQITYDPNETDPFQVIEIEDLLSTSATND